jgi:hypothetical protein
LISFLTYSEARQFASGVNEAALIKSAQTESRANTFLSHSHADIESLAGVVSVLSNHGGVVYVDVVDKLMPIVPSEDTALIVREQIRRCPRFVVLVSTSSKNSRWIPWELGLADGTGKDASIALFPLATTGNEQSWSEVEYLSLYRRIVWGNFPNKAAEWLVYDHHNNSASRLSDWIKNGF